MNAEIKNRFHLILPVPFIVILIVLLFNGLTSKTSTASPAKNGRSINIRNIFGSKPKALKSLELAANCDTASGLDTDFIPTAIIRGKPPIIFDAIRIAAIITIYLQRLFFPKNVDSRWFIVP